MNTQDLTTTILVDQTPQEAFEAINNVKGWWTENLEGRTQQLNDEFSVRFADVHYSKQRLTEVIPGIKVVWLITESNLSFIKDKNEWTGTKIIFEISQKEDKTEVRFTHQGLVPKVECYKDCSGAWIDYMNNSLRNLITTGKGQPTRKEKMDKV